MEVLLLQVVVGFFAILAIVIGVQDGMRPGGWLEGVGNWFSQTFGIGQARAAQPQTSRAPATPSPAHGRAETPTPAISPQVQQRWQEFSAAQGGQTARRPISPLETEHAFITSDLRDNGHGYYLAIPASESAQRAVRVRPPERGVVLSVGQSGSFPGSVIEIGHADGRTTTIAGLDPRSLQVRPGDVVSPSGRDAQGRPAADVLGVVTLPASQRARRGESAAAHVYISQRDSEQRPLPMQYNGQGPTQAGSQVRFLPSVLAAGYVVGENMRLSEPQTADIAPPLATPPSARAAPSSRVIR